MPNFSYAAGDLGLVAVGKTAVFPAVHLVYPHPLCRHGFAFHLPRRARQLAAFFGGHVAVANGAGGGGAWFCRGLAHNALAAPEPGADEAGLCRAVCGGGAGDDHSHWLAANARA